ncbi:hypothetical protein HY086_03810 [Candidatus Gottesmanbacteria bacterium]|nr:hypothetical protein [Candidatus Gottesmanbacteria bacterium]
MFILASGIALVFAAVNSIGFIAGVRMQPAHTVFLGMTHFPDDYFFYLSHFTQGAAGAVMTANRYTAETTAPSILYVTNLLMGKIGSLATLAPYQSYNLWVFLLSFAVLITTYILLKRVYPRRPFAAISGLLFSAAATSLINHIWVDGQGMWYPFQLWRSPHFAFDRLGAVPHQLTQTLLFLWIILLLVPARATPIRLIITPLLATVLTILNPVQAIILLIGVWFITVGNFFARRIRLAPLLVTTAAVGLSAFLVSQIINTLPHLQSKLWEAQQQTTTSLPFLFASIGPIAWLALVGMLKLRSHDEQPWIRLSTFFVVASYAAFLSPLPKLVGITNTRIIFPALYPFFGILAVAGTDTIAKFLHKKFSLPRRLSAGVVLVSFLAASLPTLVWEINQKLLPFNNRQDPLIYLPQTVAAGFSFLGQREAGAIVLANPGSHMDLLVPALSNHTTYSGHMLATIDASHKSAEAVTFFNLTMPAAKTWLTTRAIRYIVWTTFDGNRNAFAQAYPWLVPVYANATVVVYRLPSAL